jgi:RNA 3'-phosphate cyclase
MIQLDGNFGEGGGQIIRTALALSQLTFEPFHVPNIRSGRKDAGLKMQHLHAIKALQKLTGAEAAGAELGSTELTFTPKPLKGRSLSVDIETAGSITLFLQAVLLPCCFADKQMKIEIIGGTDVAWAMPVDYFREVLIPQLQRWAEIKVSTEKRGYYPAGGGKVTVRITPRVHRSEFADFKTFAEKLREQPRIELTEQHNLIHIKGISHASKSLEGARVAERQAHSAQQALASLKCPVTIRSEYSETLSPGSGITLWAVFSRKKDDIDVENPIIIGADALGEKGKPAEEVGKEAALKLIDAVKSEAPVDSHLADNLIPWMGLFASSTIKTAKVTPHATTNIYVVEKFLPVKFSVKETTISSALRA